MNIHFASSTIAVSSMPKRVDRRFGMFPTEGYRLSNDPTVPCPPAFEDSAFEVGANPASISIAIRY